MSISDVFERADDIAIVGMAGRFPGARDIHEFWRGLREGIESISFFSREELKDSGVSEELLSNPSYVRAKGTLEAPEMFDASFFDIGSREAELMDPQHRVMLECAWEALESAGYDPKTYKGRIGLFAGQTRNNYLSENLLSNTDLVKAVGAHQALLGCEPDYLTTRVSYKLGLGGPSVTVQTACSTSLVAVHLACQSLLNGECGLAMAGGVSITFPQKKGYIYHDGGILSPDGHCRAFDAQARGCIEGSGAGIVVLKTLEDALNSGDFIWAVIKGSAVNNDGALKAGYTAPSVEGQAEVIAEAIRMASIDVRTINYIEAHGTGTNLGDPIEIAALTRAFRALGFKQDSCAIGSVKTNIGHLDVAAGVAGLIKTALSLKHEMLPPSLHFQRANPEIDFDNSPFHVNAKLTEWKAGGRPRRAGVSSFGIGGTNAHVVVEEAPVRRRASETGGPQVLVISARSVSALDRATSALADHLKETDGLSLADTAYTLQMGRRAFEYRRMAVCEDVDDAIEAFSQPNSPRVFTSSANPSGPAIAFMFPGQGMQHVNMALGIHRSNGLFAKQVDLCSEMLTPLLGIDLREVLYPAPDRVEEAAGQLNQTSITQPALFVIEYALAKFWMKLGVRPQAMIGHSIGEYVAACLAGVFSLEDAIKLVAARGRLMQSLPEGAMLAVTLPEDELQPMLGPATALAAVNGPSHCVASGPPEAIRQLQATLEQRGANCRQLPTSRAFHSEMTDAILGPFAEELERVKLNPPTIPFISNVTGTYIGGAEATEPAYWARHLRQTVLFDKGLRELLKEPGRAVVEVGPGRGLSALAKRHPNKSEGQIVCSSLRHENEERSDFASLLTAVGQLWVAGAQLNWRELHEDETCFRVPLPTYPFERKRYWVDVQPGARDASQARASAGKRSDVTDWLYAPLWKQTLLPAPNPGRRPGEDCRWLVFLDGCGVGKELLTRLRYQQRDVTIVTRGEEFGLSGDGQYAINPGRAEDYLSLLNALRSDSGLPRMILHLWSVTADDEVGAHANRLPGLQELSFYSLIYLAQAIGAQPSTGPIQLTLVSNNMSRVAFEQTVYPEKATLLGPCRVIPQEYPNITCRSIDITIPDPASLERKRLLDRLEAEILSESPDKVVAYRGAERWMQSFEPLGLQPAGAQQPRLRDGGVYLVTGGLGGVGFELACFIAQTVKAKLVLTGRSPLPDRSYWEQHLAARGKLDEVSQKIEKVRALERMGADVLALSADVADFDQMRAALSRAREEFGQINGVIHAAGVSGGGVIQLKKPETAAAVLAPKVNGTLVIDALLKDDPVDLLVLCSSLTSILGGFGQADYCAANAFLDAFAHCKSAQSDTFTVSINWDAWKEIGMAARSSAMATGEQTLYEEVSHPLLDRRVAEGDGRETYLTDFSPERHWVLNEHRILGHPVIPGTTYLEMARAISEKQAPGEAVEIRDVFFLTPLRVPDGAKKQVRTEVERVGDGFSFLIKSRADSASESAPEWQQHAVGVVALIGSQPATNHSVKELLERCDRQEVAFPGGKMAEDDGPRWQSIKGAHLGDGEVLVAIEMPEAFIADLGDFWLHPALLDVATGVAKRFFGDGSVYLPFSYKRIIVRAPLRQKMFSYARFKKDADSSKETLTFDMAIMDERGAELAAIEEFTSKRVNDAAFRIRAWEEADAAARPAAGGVQREWGDIAGQASGYAMLTKEAVEVFSRILGSSPTPQVIVSTKDIRDAFDEIESLTSSIAANEVEGFNKAASVHPRPDLKTAFAGPTTETEEKLSVIWQELFGIERAGINDNFFELGGDSVLAIQIILRAKKLGLNLAPQHLFQHQTIAELAAAADSSASTQPDQGPVVGTAPLAPFQHRIFEQAQAWPNRRVNALLLELGQGLDAPLIESALQHLLKHHDALRLRFGKGDGGWQQEHAPVGAAIPLQRAGGAHLADRQLNSLAESIASQWYSSLDLSKEPLIGAALLESGPGESAHLLLMIHELLADRKSWDILLDDLRTACDQLRQGKQIQLPPKSLSFKRWSEALSDYARSQAVEREYSFWLDEARARRPRLPRDFAAAPEVGESAPPVSASLTPAETEILVEKVASANRSQVSELLLAALAQTISNWSRQRRLLVDLESDYRSGLVEGADLSRTVGQLTSIYPVLLETGGSSTVGDALTSVKEQLRRSAQRGFSYELLRYLADSPRVAERAGALPRAEVKFNYREEYDPKSNGSSAIGRVVSFIEAGRRFHSNQPYLFEVTGRIDYGRLHLEWSYSEAAHRRSTVEALARGHCDALRWLIANAQSSEAAGVTASDFPLANLDKQKFNKLSLLLEKADAS